jgi:excisionase family DNA binding protein
MKARHNDRILDPDEACNFLKLKKSTLYSWVFQGRIPHFKLGRLLRFWESELLRWLQSGG